MTPAAVTLCFLVRTTGLGVRQVLLGRKKTGFGLGKIVGLGGHVEAGETSLQAACREVEEEAGIVLAAEDADLAGTISFIFPAKPQWNMDAAVFIADRWQGEPEESDELVPQWYEVDDLPLDGMWQDAEHWLPRFLNGERLAVRVVLNEDNESVAESLAEVFPG
ncbi:8-oxo-dGTP diphosphatase [Paenarthrobacter sp. DKR-5]|uniref:8-oxo-dGTP diphosphatase n=1 Tax=Paenarthrobacter sp. DKR-5 TaxID=2835535 RepID=UPI001BDBEBBA|nr:8-oxo-dGTP diphosphatase [Paenarthrobacter sp. DKR-5]MBT1002203.1 8-oxo-dGTP diphosphatase [Paenarthrobacter sp. DKR-5]